MTLPQRPVHGLAASPAPEPPSWLLHTCCRLQHEPPNTLELRLLEAEAADLKFKLQSVEAQLAAERQRSMGAEQAAGAARRRAEECEDGLAAAAGRQVTAVVHALQRVPDSVVSIRGMGEQGGNQQNHEEQRQWLSNCGLAHPALAPELCANLLQFLPPQPALHCILTGCIHLYAGWRRSWPSRMRLLQSWQQPRRIGRGCNPQCQVIVGWVEQLLACFLPAWPAG